MFNARSVRNKADIIHQLIIDSKSSIVDITETWLTNNDSSIPSQLTQLISILFKQTAYRHPVEEF